MTALAWAATPPDERSPDGVTSRSRWLNVWLPAELFEQVVDAATACGQSKRAWARDLIEEHFA